MKSISSGTTPRRRTIDELDTDLLTTLEELDKRLYAVLSKTTRYRNILGHEINSCTPAPVGAPPPGDQAACSGPVGSENTARRPEDPAGRRAAAVFHRDRLGLPPIPRNRGVSSSAEMSGIR